MRQVAPVLIVIAILFAACTAALAYGLGKEGARGGFGSLGSMGKTTAAGPPPAACSNSLDFSDGCNSQYLL